MKGSKKIVGLLLALVMMLSLVPTMAFAGTNEETPVYSSMSIYGDSLCLGFDAAAAASAMDPLTFDIRINASENKYPYSYPSVLAEKLGISPTDDLRNYGVCAAWSDDMYNMLTDVFWQYVIDGQSYDYYAPLPYDGDTTFVLPADFTGSRSQVDTTAEGYDVADPSTWVYTGAKDENDKKIKEDYTIPAGTEIKVAMNTPYEYEGVTYDYLQLNDAITSHNQYMYCTRDSYDADGYLKDNNGDGIINSADITFYPTVEKEFEGNWYGWTYTYTDWVADTDTYGDTLGEAIFCPLFTAYQYYKHDTDEHIQSDDLLMLAVGGNDIYHSIIDTGAFMSGDTSMLGQIVSVLSIALMTNGSSITAILNDENYSAYIEQLLGTNLLGSDFGDMMLSSETPVDLGDVQVGDLGEGGFDFGTTGSVDILSSLTGVMTAMGLEDTLSYWSTENVNAYMAEMIKNYKAYYTKCVEYMVANKKDSTPLVLVGNYNPFGMVNYLQMLAGALENGQLMQHLGEDGSALLTVLQGILGTSDVYSEIQGMDEQELQEAAETAQSELSGILGQLSALKGDLTDEQVDQLFCDLSFPLTVLVMGNGLSDVYTEMNNFLANLADEYADDGVIYVDISNAPANNRYDPHPNEKGHKWIAEKIYQAIVPTIDASIVPGGTGSGTITDEGTTNVALFGDKTYTFTPDKGSKLSAVFIDEELVDPQEYPEVYENGSYTFENVMKSHTITVQFDKTYNAHVCAVGVLNSYAKKSGAGWNYASGDIVYVDAGSRPDYEFAGWVNCGPTTVKLKDASASRTCFVMPCGNVCLMAIWKPIEYTLTFETNGGTPVEPVKGTVCSGPVDLRSHVTTRDNYTFAGWYLDAELTQPVDFIKLDKDTTVYAKWTPVDYTLTFETNGGSGVDSVIGNIESAPIDLTKYVPTKDGYTFVGWYADEALTQAITSVTLDHNTTVYAKWTPGVATGDHSSMALWAAVASISALLAVAFVLRNKKYHA